MIQENDILNGITNFLFVSGMGISPTAAMNAAEHLYTSGYISYPRYEFESIFFKKEKSMNETF